MTEELVECCSPEPRNATHIESRERCCGRPESASVAPSPRAKLRSAGRTDWETGIEFRRASQKKGVDAAWRKQAERPGLMNME